MSGFAYTLDECPESFIASGDLSHCLNRVVNQLPVDHICGLAAGDDGIGVLLNAPRDTETASVVIKGTTMVRVGAAVTAGDFLTAAASGWAITAAVTAGHQAYFGRARTTAASGMLSAVFLERGYLPNSIA